MRSQDDHRRKQWIQSNHSDDIMGAIASQITSPTSVYSTVYSDADQRKHQSPALLALCVGNSPGTGEFSAHMASNAENVSIWWRHHVQSSSRSGRFTCWIRNAVRFCKASVEERPWYIQERIMQPMRQSQASWPDQRAHDHADNSGLWGLVTAEPGRATGHSDKLDNN